MKEPAAAAAWVNRWWNSCRTRTEAATPGSAKSSRVRRRLASSGSVVAAESGAFVSTKRTLGDQPSVRGSRTGPASQRVTALS